VRSGKTVASSLAWINYLAHSPESVFIMSGRSQGSLFRNVIGGEFGLLAMLGNEAEYRTNREGNRVLLINTPNGVKQCYCFGANDARAYGPLRGLTAGGWYADEINMHDRLFVEEALRRTIISRDRKHFWTLNPDTPKHYIYTDYLDKYQQEGLPGFHLWHFTLEDNLAITPERKAELVAQYSGVFYDRYILGLRVVAEGVIYGAALSPENYYTQETRPQGLEYLAQRTIAVDYGTTNPCVFLDIFDDGDVLWVDREYYWDSKREKREKENAEYADDFLAFQAAYPDHPGSALVDPSANSFILTLRNRGVLVREAKNDVLEGIRFVASLIKRRKMRFNRDTCPNTCQELHAYRWNEKAAALGVEEPVKENDHSCDPLRYQCLALPHWRLTG